MKGLKRTVRKYGSCKGHQAGTDSEHLLGYVEARKAIYLPAYTWVLENKLAELAGELAANAAKQAVVLLDYETNSDVEDTRKPLSHASLIAAVIRERR